MGWDGPSVVVKMSLVARINDFSRSSQSTDSAFCYHVFSLAFGREGRGNMAANPKKAAGKTGGVDSLKRMVVGWFLLPVSGVIMMLRRDSPVVLLGFDVLFLQGVIQVGGEVVVCLRRLLLPVVVTRKVRGNRLRCRLYGVGVEVMDR